MAARELWHIGDADKVIVDDQEEEEEESDLQVETWMSLQGRGFR